MPFTYSAEIFPLSHRVIGMSLSVSVLSAFASILSLSFPYLLSTLHAEGAFGLYAVGNVVAWGLTWCFVPEVKGLRLEEIDGVFERGLKKRVGEQWRTLVGRKEDGDGEGRGGYEIVAGEDGE